MNESGIEQVSDTAFMAAAYRAVETDRPRALFRDPLPAKLAGASPGDEAVRGFRAV